MIETRIVRFDDGYAPEIRAIRGAVFTGEQGFDANEGFSGQDPDAVHVLVTCDGKYVGTARVLKDGHIGRVAVLREYWGRGLGASMVQAPLQAAEKAGMNRLYLGSQKHAVDFYVRLVFPFLVNPLRRPVSSISTWKESLAHHLPHDPWRVSGVWMEQIVCEGDVWGGESR